MTRLADDEVALVIVGRDVGYFLDHHIRHHRAMGVSHVVYIDNGSSDDSIEIARQFTDITIASCTANFREHQGRIRLQANTRFLKGGWRLAIDPDELLDYPGADRIGLPELTRRMARRRHSALVAQMLEMVPDGPLSEACGLDFAQAAQRFDRCSLNEINRLPYHDAGLRWGTFLDQNRTTNPDIPILFGGIRRAAFGENCCLTKHPLFRMAAGVVPHPHPHVTEGVTCTDFSAVLRHYKFAGNTLARERKLVAEGRLSHGEARLRISALEGQGDMHLGRYAEMHDPSVETLVERGFLHMSDAARAMLA